MSAEQLRCELGPAGAGAPARTLKLAAAQELVGRLRTDAQGWALTGLGCARLLLDVLSWTFGKLWLHSESGAELSGLAAEIASTAQALQVRVSLQELRTPRLKLAIGSLELSAQVLARELSLEVGETVGVLRAQSAVFSAFELRSGELWVEAPELTVSELTVDWGGDAFRLEAGTAQASALHVEQASAKLRAERVSVAALRAHGPQLAVGQTRIGRVELERPAQPERPASPAAAVEGGGQEPLPSRSERDLQSPSKARLIDPRLFDGLAGRLSADVVVDVSVPIIGHRRATHELRVGVEAGAVDFRELEHGLARLEDSLLDFSVREGALVLELGLPLIATRGRGKPILVWDLSAPDLELAQRGRVRLAMLPSFRFASRSDSDPPSEEGGGSAFRLRELALRDVDFGLTLLQPPVVADAALRALAFADLTIRGGLFHRADEPDGPGALRVTARSVRTELQALPLGGRTVSGRVEIAALEQASIACNGFRPRGGHAFVEGLAIADFVLG